MQPTPTRCASLSGRRAATLIVASTLMLLGCSNAKQGAVSGAGVGALSGLAIGSLSGNAGKGAAIGAVVGGVGGGIIGDQNRRSSEAASGPGVDSSTSYATAAPLQMFVGSWAIDGMSMPLDQTPFRSAGSGRGTIDKNFFIRLDLVMEDPRTGQVVEGTSIIGQQGGSRLTMDNSSSSSPLIRRFEGEMDASGNLFSFREVAPGGDRRIIIRIESPNGWTADVWERSGGTERKVETLAFRRVGA